MSTYTVNEQEAAVSATGLKGIMQSHPIASYFVLMFAGLWLAYLPLLLSSQGFGVLDFAFPFPPVLFNLPASLLGPFAAGLVMSWVVGGKQGRQEFRRSVFRFRVSPQWYLLPLIAVPVLGVLSAAVMQGIEPIGVFAGQIGGFVGAYLLNTILLFVIVQLWEESGQMGFVTPRVQRRRGAVAASLVVAVTWALMHLPSLFVPEMGVGIGGPLSLENIALGMGIMIAFAIPVRFIATWLYNCARQSVVVVALFHSAMNATQSELQKVLPGYNSIYLIGAFAVVSFIVIAVTRGKLGYKQDEVSALYQDDALRAATPVAQV